MPRASVAVLGGTGQQGRGLAQRLARAGYSIVVGSRDPARAAATVAAWSATAPIESADYGSAIGKADIVILAVPFDAVGALIEQHHARFKPQALVIDVTVPLSFAGGTATLVEMPDGSAAQFIKARLPAHARLAATFKTVPAHLLNAIDRSLDCDELVCGDTAESRDAAAALVQAIPGLRAIDVGSLARARSIEHLTLLAVAINRRHKTDDARYRIVGL